MDLGSRIDDLRARFSTKHLIGIVFVVLAVGGGAYMTMGGSAADSGDKLDTLRIGHVPSALSSPHYTAIEEGFYRRAGFDAKMVQMPGPQIGKALLNGKIEIGSSATTPAAYQRAANVSLRLVAARAGFTEDGPGGAYFIARNGSGIHSAEDIRGKTVCLSTAGGMGELWLAMWADRHNMTAGEDFQRTFIGGETKYRSVLASGSVDACYLDVSHPTYTFLKQDNLAYKFDEMPHGDWVAAFVSVRTNWVKNKPDKLRRFLRAYVKAARYARNHPQERIENVAKYTRFSEETLRETVLPKVPRNLTVPVKDLNTVQHLMAEYGLVEQRQQMGPLVYNDAVREIQQQVYGN